ncbi:glutathione S-transferase family protein [Parvularcula maris]|uniref:Glutathione S-transferase family protein n=1 Tax=Parvularcula maris TaxID=2965077 RepID=A0A9X2LAU8_9PROT|nr:glutathione S-transferase family protein [Parvularcula maris]MCQ8186084.1 glutathione S-transferase family protein [Parvularcula maris]
MTLTIYHSPFARSVRVRWQCLEQGLSHEIERVENNKAFLATPEYRAVNPAGKIPALKDGELILFESTAIQEYLLTKPGAEKLAPKPGDKLYGPFLQWLHFGEAGMGMYVTLALAHNKMLPEEHRIPAMAAWGKREAENAYEVLAGPLRAHDYLLPSGFSAADISVVYMLLLAKFAGIFDGAPDEVKAYFGRCTEREHWKTATAD